ncbi:MAG TPA: lipid-A-disaccharide synthase [Steroidobacteraceae bacterium]|nr:lipid-A-disaccharide synthase [Steroidobacteraceae bacterium]HNS28711.1 lipid-A-disaccharide synthase [Steroidobacteraceae bacterium]
MALRVGIVAGEASGDTLGAAFITALRERDPGVQVFGVAGPKMIAAGCEAWESSESLAVMGVTEVLRHLPRLWRLRRRLAQRFLAAPPDVFVGIDAPEFNLGLERRLKGAMPTVQYVSPQVWAWRQGRVRGIGRSCDLVLCLLPFETRFYAEHDVRAVFVGHPLADRIPLAVDRDAARAALGVAREATVVAVLPGSRVGEVTRLGADFAAACAMLARQRPDTLFLAPMANAAVRELFDAQWREHAPGICARLLDGQADGAIIAADVVLVASGTATLETTLCKRPMVVAYRLGAITALLLRTLGLVKVAHFSQPNLLAGEELVPEFFQEAVTPAALAGALAALLDDPARAALLARRFLAIHESLRVDGARRAADAVLELVRR